MGDVTIPREWVVLNIAAWALSLTCHVITLIAH